MSFSVASYNVLADAYLNLNWYPDTPATDLEPRQRRPALLRRVAELGANVLCFQEVESDLFAALQEHLRPLDYEGRFAQKGAGKPDGCATFVKTTTFTVHSVRVFHYADGKGAQPDSGHVALLHVLKYDGRFLGIANTHVKWDRPGTPEAVQWGYRQIAQLLRERDITTNGCATWIICGDLNATANSALVRLLFQAGFMDAYRGYEHMNTCNPNRQAKRIDYLFHTAGLRARPIALPTIDGQTVLPSVQEPSDHLPVMAWFDWDDAGNTTRNPA